MKGSVLDVLIALFEHYVESDAEQADEDEVERHLMQAGFTRPEVDQALGWLAGLGQEGALVGVEAARAAPSTRLFCADEQQRLGLAGQGMLLFLEQSGVLDPTTRERVIDRVMALDVDEVELEQLKWVTLMVLFNQPGKESAARWMEDLVEEHPGAVLH